MFQINPNIPLQALANPVNFADSLTKAQNYEANALKLQALRDEYNAAKEERDRKKAMRQGMASELQKLQQGTPAQYRTTFPQTMPTGQMPQGMTGVLASERGQNLPQPALFGENILQGNFDINRELVSPEIAPKKPDIKDVLTAQFNAAVANNDAATAFDAKKKLLELEKNPNKYFGGLTEAIDPVTKQPILLAMTEGGAVPSGYSPRVKEKEQKAPITWKVGKGRTEETWGYDAKGNQVLLGVQSLDAPPSTQPRQPRLQQVTNENGTYLLDVDTGETKPVIVGGKQLKPAAPIKDPSGEESKSAGYAFRMNQANKIINDFEASKKGLPTYAPSIAGGVPFVGDYLERKFQDKDQQLYKNAALAWLRAKLRDESGATIQNLESSNEYKTYFPVVGDEPETIKQKAYLRDIAEREMILKSGKAVNKLNEAKAKKDKEEYLFERAKALKSGNQKLVETLDAKANEMGML